MVWIVANGDCGGEIPGGNGGCDDETGGPLG